MAPAPSELAQTINVASTLKQPPIDDRACSQAPSQPYLFRSKLPDIQVPDHLPLAQYCLERAGEFAEKPCIIQAGAGSRAYSYADVQLLARRIAGGLAQLGVGKGEVIMLLLPNCAEFVLSFLGAAMRGAITTTCNPFYTAGEIAKQMTGSGAKLIITQSAYAHKLLDVVKAARACGSDSKISMKVITIDEPPPLTTSSSDGADDDELQHYVEVLPFSSCLDEAEAEAEGFDSIHPDDVVALPYSSGTTGLPKGVMLTHRSLVTSVAQQVDGDNPNLYFRSDDVVLCVLPMFHIYSLNSVLLCSLRVGATIAVMPKFEIEALLDLIQRHRVTVAPLVPPIVLALAKNPLVAKYDLSSIRMLMSGAAPLGKDLEDAFKSRVPHAIIGQGYGMTEAGPLLAMSLAFAKHPFPVKAGSCGTVVRNALVKIIDPETGVSLPHNTPGEICIKGAQIMKGYINDPLATSNTIDEEGFLHTGDIGIIDDDDEVFIVDRVKEIIKFKGFQVPPAELEGILVSHPGIADAACVPKKDEVAGEVPVAFVVPISECKLNEDEVKEFVSKQVVFYKKLHSVIFVDHIPKSPSGKILRKDLKKRLEEDNGE